MALTWIGIVVMLGVLMAWVVLENRRLLAHVAARGAREAPPAGRNPG